LETWQIAAVIDGWPRLLEVGAKGDLGK